VRQPQKLPDFEPDFELESSFNFCYNHYMNIGQKLHNLRTAKGLSQGDIEKRTGLLRCYTSRVEHGHTVPNLDTLQKYAGALEIELYQLFYEGEGKPKPASNVLTEPGTQERGLLDAFRKLGKRERGILVGIAGKLAKSGRPKGRATR
jgi:transcriptional regulator with XRE-family HTH domain